MLRGAGASVGAIGLSTPTPSLNNGRKLNVFHDDDDERHSRSQPSGASTKGWEDIGTVASRNQENIQADRLSGMKSFKIGAQGGVSKKPGSGLAVFRDSDDDDDDDEDHEVSATPKAGGVLSPKDAMGKSAVVLVARLNPVRPTFSEAIHLHTGVRMPSSYLIRQACVPLLPLSEKSPARAPAQMPKAPHQNHSFSIDTGHPVLLRRIWIQQRRGGCCRRKAREARRPCRSDVPSLSIQQSKGLLQATRMAVRTDTRGASCEETRLQCRAGRLGRRR